MSKKWWILIILAIILGGCCAFVFFRQKVGISDYNEFIGDLKNGRTQYTELDECKIKQNKCYELQKSGANIICLLCPSDLGLNEDEILEIQESNTGSLQQILRENEIKMAEDHPLMPPEECPEGEDWFCIPNTCTTLERGECGFTCGCAVDNF